MHTKKKKRRLIFFILLFPFYWVIAQSSGLNLENFQTVYPNYFQNPYHKVEALITQQLDTLHIIVNASFDSTMIPIKQTILRDENFGQDDAIVIIIDPNGAGKDGYIFAVNSVNTQSDSKISNISQNFKSWNYNWKSHTALNKDFWIAEFWIPMIGLIQTATDSIKINIIRGPIKRPSGVFELCSLVPFGQGVPFINVQYTRWIPFIFRSNASSLNGYIIPYIKNNRINGKWDTPLGFQTKINYSHVMLQATYHPDFSAVEANIYSLNIITNRYRASENRSFFAENQKFTSMLINTIIIWIFKHYLRQVGMLRLNFLMICIIKPQFGVCNLMHRLPEKVGL